MSRLQQWQMMMQQQMQQMQMMHMMVQRQQGQMAAGTMAAGTMPGGMGGMPVAVSAAEVPGQTGPAQFNDLVSTFQQKNTISGPSAGMHPQADGAGMPGGYMQSAAAAAAPSPAAAGGESGNPFDMFG
ncbi:unnamed protein product [Polarella glacialis]|uniref:Uncharacterized protein n=1 Tax=Polarella glacialis TaxID=89957 RepID=A0A813JDW3_POLGL|nr:unnamed protein product [Polarella glacialis]